MLAWMQTLVQGRLKRQPPRDTLGDRGENLAARHLRNLGYRIITRNFRCPLGEIDIVARDGSTLVFCEVKTRAYDDQGVSKIGYVSAQGGKVETVASDFGGTAMGRPYPGGALSVAGGRVAYTRAVS